jgi:hypothetical protein
MINQWVTLRSPTLHVETGVMTLGEMGRELGEVTPKLQKRA